MNRKDYIFIYKDFNLVEIELIKSNLTDKDIPYTLRTNDAGGTMPHLKLERGTEILIPEEEEQEAKSCLQNTST